MTESPAIHSPMSEEHEKHLAGIINDLARDVSKKYRKGQEEHGGALWRRPVWKDTWDEVLDLCTYVHTLRLQLGVIADLALQGASDESLCAAQSRENCRQILAVLQGFPSAQDKK
jgi:hypothetical protein